MCIKKLPWKGVFFMIFGEVEGVALYHCIHQDTYHLRISEEPYAFLIFSQYPWVYQEYSLHRLLGIRIKDLREGVSLEHSMDSNLLYKQ
jgi:hypothetical protein